MEVSGSKTSSDSIISCQPCQGVGDTEQAEGYCKNCNQYICSICIKDHRKFNSTKNHVIKSKDEMPKSLAAQSDSCTEVCDVHKTEILTCYCKEHDSVGCRDCMVLEHTSCKIQLVSDLSGNYDNSDELVLIKHRIDHFKKNLISCKEEIKRSLKTADEIKTSIIKEIKQFRKEVDAYLDKVTKVLMLEVEKLSASDVSRQQKLLGQSKATAEDIEKLQRKIERCKDKVNDLFVISKQVQKKLHKYQEINEEISSKSQINIFKFTPSENINTLKVQNICLGNLDTQVKKFAGQRKRSIIDMKATFVRKFNLIENKESDCYISGMTSISEVEILCADSRNKTIKIYNYKEGKITSTLRTSGSPTDITTINSSSAATTLYQLGEILFLNTQNGLVKSHSLKVRDRCCGIVHRTGILAVTFIKPAAVQVIDMEGHILHEVKDTILLKRPDFISMCKDNKSMFVSDWENNAMYQITVKGHLNNTFKSEEMKFSAGITVTNCGNVLVCYSNKVGVIVSGTKAVLPLNVPHDALSKPCSILICEEQNKMFISEHWSSEDGNYIKLFDLQ